jgi:DNA-binding transcriptional LysR family regulator
MALRPALDLELLRTLVFIAEEASFTKAAERVGRTQSAVTLQIQKLEALVGQPLVIRSKGGPVELTAQGRALVESAYAMLRLNDEALRAAGSADIRTTIRLATSVAFVDYYLDESLKQFTAAFPNALVEVFQENQCQIAPQVRDGSFDLVLCAAGYEPRGWPSTEISHVPFKWVTSAVHLQHLREPLPLALAPGKCPWLPAWMNDCHWRSNAMQALAHVGRPYEVVASANTLEGLYAPVLAGHAVTVSSARLPAGLRAVGHDEGLPPLPDDVAIIIKSRNAVQPYTDALTEIIRSTFSFD